MCNIDVKRDSGKTNGFPRSYNKNQLWCLMCFYDQNITLCYGILHSSQGLAQRMKSSFPHLPRSPLTRSSPSTRSVISWMIGIRHLNLQASVGDTETHGAVFVLLPSFHTCSWLRRPVVNDEIEICLHCTPGFHGKSSNYLWGTRYFGSGFNLDTGRALVSL